MKRIVLAVLLLVSVSFSCYRVTKVSLISQLRDAPRYDKELKKWTQNTLHYYLHDIKFEIWSTYKSWPLRLAYMKEYSKKFKLSAQDQQKMYARELSDYNNKNEFFVTIFSYMKDMNDLSDDDAWKLYLSLGNTSGNRLEPERIVEVDIDTNFKYFYPHINPWTRAFDVSFSRVVSDATDVNPVAEQFSTLSLMLASVKGEHTFTYGIDRLRPVSEE